ncbi:MAG TPA: ABC transporter substrate-binding protein [Dehalococcoidia bacterium]|nr:ABC transporter substrate-binding protein [Dehalococcoidia bacterium]
MVSSEYWQRFSRQRISRRTALATGAAGMGAAALALAGCGGGKEQKPTGGTPSGTPTPGGILRSAANATALSIDPHTEIAAGLAFIPYIYGYLIHEYQLFDGPPQLLQDHAESMEQPDDLVFNFKLRQGIRFQNLPPANGREVVAEDVVYSCDRIAALAQEPFWRTYIAGKSALSPYEFQLRLNDRYAYTTEDVGGVRAAIVPKEAVDAWDDLNTRGLGSGPFQAKEFSNQGISLERNPNYYVQGIPYIDGLNWRSMADEAAIRIAFRAKQVDSYAPPTKIQADDVAGYGEDVTLIKDPNLFITKVNINELSRPELQDVRVREAIDISFDRDAMIEKLAFGEGNYTGPASWGLTFWSLPQDELRQRFKRDLTKARQLLGAAGADDITIELKFVTTTASDVCAMIKEQLAEAGITVNLVPQEFGTFITDRSAGAYELMVGAGLPYPSERYPMQFNHTTNFTRNQRPVRLPEPEIDALLDQILMTPDVNERQSLVLEATRLIIDRHGPFYYLFAPYAYTARWDYVRGYEKVPSTAVGYTYDMWLDKS